MSYNFKKMNSVYLCDSWCLRVFMAIFIISIALFGFIMTTIKIQAEDEILAVLKQIAKSKLTTVEALAKETLLNYLQIQPSKSKTYSFIGIGHSGKTNILKQVEATLNETK